MSTKYSAAKIRRPRAKRGLAAAKRPVRTRRFHATTAITMSRAICAGSSR